MEPEPEPEATSEPDSKQLAVATDSPSMALETDGAGDKPLSGDAGGDDDPASGNAEQQTKRLQLEPEPEPEPESQQPEQQQQPEPEPELGADIPGDAHAAGLGAGAEADSRSLDVSDEVCVEIGTDEDRDEQAALEAIIGSTVDAAAHGALETRVHAREEALLAPHNCPAGHRLLGAHVPRPGFTCDVCGVRVRQGTLLYGCRPCNSDECEVCYHYQGAPHEGEPPARRAPRRSANEQMTAQEIEEMEPLITYTEAEIAQMSEQEQLAAVIAMSLQQATAAISGRGAGHQTSVPEFLCKICYMNDAEEDAITLRCGHRWHKECLLQLLRSKVSDGKLQILCPDISDDVDERELLGNAREVGCTQIIGKPTIFALADELGDTALQEQYTRFEELDQNPNVRECPVDGCGHRQEGSPRSPKMQCEKCGLEYCFFHSAAHPPSETCRAYEQRQRRSNAEHAKFVAGFTMPCPWCKKPTTKQGGCNHMTCSTCGKDWCWVCGRKTANNSWHYDDANVWGCPGMQFASEFSLLHRYALYTLRMYSIVLVLPLFLSGMVTALASIVVCSPCLVIVFRQGRPRGGECLRLLLMLGVWPLGLSVATIIMVTSLVTALLVLPIACMVKPCRLALRERDWFDTAMVRFQLPATPATFTCLSTATHIPMC
jgi:hypothetical protein